MASDNTSTRLKAEVSDTQGIESVIPDLEAPEDHEALEDEPTGELPEEEDDNPYQESDEALPDDEEEEVIERNPEREEKRFDDV